MPFAHRQLLTDRFGRAARAALAGTGTFLVALLCVPHADAATQTMPSVLAGQQSELSTIVNDFMGQGPESDMSYANGVWSTTNGPLCWYCYDEASLGAATLGEIESNAALEQDAITTVSDGIAEHQLANGEFADDSNPALDQVDTVFVSSFIGVSYLELYNVLPEGTRVEWAASLAAASDYLVRSGASTWYINGNVNLHEVEDFWLTYEATGDATYLTDYENELSFTEYPSQSRWPGYGLHISAAPTGADGVGGSGYLAESNGSDTPGFDANYTLAQLDIADDLWVLTRNAQFLTLMNLEYDQLAPLINTSSWVLNGAGGTRDSFTEPFASDAIELLYNSGTRPDLAAKVQPSLSGIYTAYQQQLTEVPNVNYWKSVGCSLAMGLIDAEWPAGLDSAVTQPPVQLTAAKPATGVAAKSKTAPQSKAAAKSKTSKKKVSKRRKKRGHRKATDGRKKRRIPGKHRERKSAQ